MDEITKIILSVKPTLKEGSIKVYKANINKLYKSLNTTKNLQDLEWIYERKKIMDFINSLKTPNTRKTYLSNIITLLNYDNNNPNRLTELQFYIKQAKDNQDNIKLKQKTDNSLEDKVIDMKVYDNLLDQVSKDKSLSREYLQFLMLKYLPIRNELSSLIFITNKDYQKLTPTQKSTNNYLIKLSKFYRVSRNNYKTKNFYGQINTDFKNTLLKTTINKYIKDNNITSNTPIFIYKDKPQTQNDLSQRLSYVSNKFIKTKLSTSSIFKIVLNDIVNNQKLSQQQKIDLIKDKGQIRGTDYKTLINYYIFKKTENLSSEEEN